MPSLRFFFLRNYLDATALASGFVASLAGIASEFIILATWLVVLGYFFGTRVITISFCSSRSLLAFFLLARVFRVNA